MKLFQMHKAFLDCGDEERRFIVATYRDDRYRAIATHVAARKKSKRVTFASLGISKEDAEMYKQLNMTPATVRAFMERKLKT